MAYQPPSDAALIAKIKGIVDDPKVTVSVKLGRIAWIIENEAR